MFAFRSFEIVDVIARSRTLSRAAEALEMSQPALTKALSALEATVGAKLFERRAAGMEPTALAQIFIRHWPGIHRDLQDIRREIDRIRGVDEGVLRVATDFLAASSAELAIGFLTRRYPGLRIDSRQDLWSDVVDAVRRGAADIGFADPADAEDDPDLQVDVLVERPAYFVCRGHHPLLHTLNPELAEILSYPLVYNLIPSRMAQFFPQNMDDFGFRKIGAGHLIPPLLVQSVSSIRNVLLSSDAVSIIPAGKFYHLFEAGHLVRIESYSRPWLTMRLGIITRSRFAHTPAIIAIMEEVRRIEIGNTRAQLWE